MIFTLMILIFLILSGFILESQCHNRWLEIELLLQFFIIGYNNVKCLQMFDFHVRTPLEL